MVYIVHSLNYCTVRGSVEYYYALATHSLRISYGFAMILVHKKLSYTTATLRYDMLPF